jgi:glycosyltransferase involved in cell wall biosynthesis
MAIDHPNAWAQNETPCDAAGNHAICKVMSKTAKPELLYIVAGSEPWKFFGEICRALHGQHFNFTFLFLHPDESLIAGEIRAAGVPCHHIRFGNRSHLPRAARQIFQFCRRQHYDLVHTHFMNACLSGLTGSWLAGMKMRVHTRHHSSPHPYSNRLRRQLLYDQINNRFSTAIIAPCADVRRRLMEEGVNPDRIEVIPNGFDLDTFHNVLGAFGWDKTRVCSNNGPTCKDSVFLDEPVEVHIDEGQARARSPVSEQAVLDVLGLQRLF